MDLTPYVTTVEDSLVAAAVAGDEGTRRTATALTAALEPATRLAIMNALSDLALEVSDVLGDRSVELRLEGGDVRPAVMHLPAADDEPEPETLAEPAGEPSRITLRLPDSLKTQAERAAAAAGVSLNTWLVHTVQEGLRGSARPTTARRSDAAGGHRLRGWVHG